MVDTVRMHPDRREPLSVITLEQPADLVRADHKKIRSEELPFLSVAYGLSNMESFLPNPYCRDPGFQLGPPLIRDRKSAYNKIQVGVSAVAECWRRTGGYSGGELDISS